MAEENPIYDYLRAEGLTDLNESDFIAKYTDRTNLQGVYTYLKENGNTDLEFTAFADKYFPLGGAQEVSSQEASEPTSQEFGVQSGTSAEASSADLDDKRSYDKYTKRTTYADVPEGLDVRQAVDLGSGVRGLSAVDPNTGEITNVIPEVEVSAPIPFSVNMKNTWENVKTQLQGVDDRLKLVSADTWENLLGKELARAWYTNVGGRDIEQVRLDAYEELQRLEEAILPTSSIGGSISRGDLIGAVSGIINATAQLGTTAIVAVPTAGAGLYTEMVGQSIYDYNKAKAEHLGLEIDELYNQGKAEFGVPTFIGILGGSLERVGFKGARGAITAAMGNGIGRSLVRVGLGANQEGMTEWLQYGLQELNTALADPDVTQEEALSAFTSAIFSEEGLENYLMGLAGSGVAAGLGGAGKFISKKARDKFSASAETIRNINQDLNNEGISPVTRAVLEDSKQTAVSEMASLVAEDAAVEDTLSPEVRNSVEGRLNDLEAIQEALQDPNISEQTKVALQQQAEQLSTEIDNLIAETDAIQERETEAVPVGERAQDSQEVDGEIRGQSEETEGQQEGQQEQIVEEAQATEPGQIFTRDIGGEQTVYRRNEDGTASIVPDAEAQQILSQPTETPVQESAQVEEVADSVQQSSQFMNPEQAETVNTTLEEIGFTPEESTSLLQDIQTEEGRSRRKGQLLNRLRQGGNQGDMDTSSSPTPPNFVPGTADDIALINSFEGSSANSILNTVIENTNTPELAQVAEALKPLVSRLDEFKVIPGQWPWRGMIEDNRITINPEQLVNTPSDLTTKTGLDSAFKTIVHEYVHATTLSAYRNPQTQADRGFKRYIDNVYAELKNNAQFRESMYGFSSPTEFIAELMTNNEFRQLAPIRQRGVWQRIVDFVRGLLGLSVETDEQATGRRRQMAVDAVDFIFKSLPNITQTGSIRGRAFGSRSDSRFLRDLTEYAVLSLTDGTIQTLDGFRELAKGLGVATEDVVNRAFYAARDIVNDYAATNPDRVSVQERAGNLIVQIQEGQQVPPATTKVTSGTVRKITDGGVQGKVTLTNRQALKTQIQTLNRGIREGRKQIAEPRKEITDFIKGMKEAGLFRGKVRGSTVNALINRVNKANTPAQLRNALDYAEKASRIIDYDQKLSTANTLKSRAKRLAKRKGIPADLVPVLKGMGGINPRYIDNIEAFNEQLAELISAVDGAGIDGIEQTQHRDLITSVKNKIEQARVQSLKDQLIDAGMGSDFVDALNTMNQLLEAVASIPDESKPSGESKREFRERIYEQTKELLGELDRTELSPQQSVALDALLGIDVSQVSDQMMATIAVVGKNAAVNQSFAGAGPIIAEYRLQQETSNQKNVDKVKSTVRIASRIGKATRERFGTIIAQIDATMRDQQAASAFYALTGFGGILEGSTRYGHRADGVKKIVEDLSKKHAKDLSDSVQSAMYAMYADLNQYKNTWTEEQRVEEFNKRKEAIQTSIDRIEEQMGRDKHFEAQQRDYLSNVKKAWEQVKSAKHPDEIYDKLNSGFKAAYSEMRGFYDSILPEMQDNALIHNNTDLDTDWVNYFPRSYKKLGRPATERKIEQIEEMAGSMGIPLDDIVNQGESSGAKQNRVITGAQLPANATINFDAFNSFYDSSLRALYDIETQPARQYAARALNSGRVAEIFGDATPLEIFRNAAIQKIGNDQLGLYGGTTGWFRSALRAMSTWGTRLALGGVGQVVKQSIPQMSDTVIRLGNNAHLLAVGLNGYLKYNDLLNEAIKDQPVSRRNVATIERQTSVINKRELNEIRKGLSTGVLRGLRIADEVVEAISLSSLKWGDDMAAKASWLAFYLEYKKRNGETVVDLASELQNPSKDAKAYATQRMELTNNVSDPSLRANTSKHIGSEMLAVVAPFSSFAINAKLELATSLSRLRELGVMNNQERLRTIRNVGGNVANILVYNVIGKTIRNIMIGGTASLAYALLNNDDWDEDDEKTARELINTWESDAIARNEENSTEYLVNDLIFGGIAERSLQPGIDVIKDLYAKAKGEQPKERFARPRTIYDALGIFGIPARTAGRFFNDLSEWTMTDAEWQMRKFSIEDAWGETRYVPLEYRGVNRPIFSRKGFGLTTLAHGVALTGASSQEVSALANRLPGLISQIETKLHGKDRKDKLVENESLRKIRVAGQTKELTEEQWEWTVNERRKFLEEVETSDRFITLQKDELASKVGDELSEKVRRETATKYARARAIIEFNLVEGVGEKIAKDAKKKASDIIGAADLWKKQLNPNTYPKQK